MFKSENDLCNVISVAVYCNADNTMLLMADTNDHWFPCTKEVGSSWEKQATKEITEIFGATPTELKILRISKILISRHTVPHLLHVVFQMNVDATTKNKSKNTMGKYRGKCRWVTQSDLIKLQLGHSLRSPEIVEIFFVGKKEQLPPTYILPEEVTYIENLVETTDENFAVGKGHFDQLVEAAGIDRLGQEVLLKDFVVKTFPAYYLNIRQLSKVALDLGWAKESFQSLFFAADLHKRFGISFKEYLFLLAAIDPATTHGGAAAEIRSRYLFKFYDQDRDGLIKGDDFKSIITDLRKVKKSPLDPPAVAKEASETYKSMGMPEGNPITESDFLKAICDLKIRGTATLFRSTVGILKLIKESSEKPAPTSAAAPGPPARLPSQTEQRKVGKPLDYEVANHSVKIQRSGQALNIDELRQIQDAVSTTTLKQPVNEQARRNSMDIFSQRSISNEVLKSLRYLTSINKINVPGGSYTWGQLDPAQFSRNLMNVAGQVKDIFKVEPRLLELRSPVYIMGDFHGNIADLLYFEKVLWHIGPGLSPCTLLFLGDYVDRGAYSIEVISYLLSYKLQSPKKVNLLRGNHEIREVQKMFTFQKECILKFGEKIGVEVWNTLNNAFDHMPIAATVDGKIFCCHGGVPPPWLCPVISAINDIPVPLTQPDAQSSLAWELMWNDPVRPKAVDEKLAVELLANEGFAVNARRGTAHIFSVEALERFLKANQLTHLIRAHEVAVAGFQVLQKGKLLTVFSSSKYCGGRNDAACIMVDSGKLRVLRLETS
ncbi:unnamed protein product [Psylliodes chrysocephalus]|uniref:Serine/threonine-protein phosphatase n=1 Tax=Psylliodes chrysocephalus TaxID=3402493 RepID=A0A9P0D499_9CUCU|nr:unnamed protein product [Psylliodes chrysocephala]